MRTLLRKLFGELTWTPPPWLRDWNAESLSRIREKTTVAFASWRAQIEADPARFAWRAAFLVAFLTAAGAVRYWYVHRPHSQRLSVTGAAPAATVIAEARKPEPVRITFGGSAARLDQIGKPLAKGAIMTPFVKGEWRWASDRELTFTPKEDWGVGQEYLVHLEKSLFGGHVLLETYEYKFKSAPLTGQISASEFYIDPKNPKLKQVMVTAVFSHPINAASFESRVSLRMAGHSEGFLGLRAKSYPFTVSYNKFKNEAYIKSANVEIPAKDTSMDVSVSEGVSAERGGPPCEQRMTQQVAIPGLYTFFHIDSAAPTLVRNERYEPEQVLVVNATAGVLESEMRKALSVCLLPRDLPPVQGRPGQRHHQWYDPAFIGPEVLALCEPVALEPIPTDKQYATLHSFKYRAEVGRFLYIRIKKGTESLGGYLLANDFDAAARIPEFPRELNIMQDGAILSLSGEKKVSVISRGIPAVRFRLGRVLPGQINHLVSQSGGQFRNPSFATENFTDENITERFDVVRTLQALEPGKTQYSAFDLSDYLTAETDPEHKRGLFFLKVESWDPVHRRPDGASDQRLILVTDLGLLVKEPRDGSRDVFVASIRSGEPAAGALVQVLGKNGLPVLSAATDQDGHAHFPRLSDFKNERQPVVFVAHRGSDLSFIPFDWSERRLNLSRFDVGGVATPQAGSGLDAYLFSDRGIYRPGDELRIGLIVKAPDWSRSLSGVPLEAVITDPRGLEVYKRRLSLSAAAFEEIKHRTEEVSPTGTYQAGVYIVKDGRRSGLLGAASVRVEEFLPDRMRITTGFSTEREQGWVSPEGLKARVALKNLFGTPAANRRVAATVTLSPAFPAFRRYADYAFFDPMHAKHSFSDHLADGTTDEKGEAEFALNLERFEKATYRAVFSAEGYEAAGGRSVGSESAVLVSSLDYLIGAKPDGDLHFISKGSSRMVELIAVDPELNRTAATGLKAQLIEVRYVSSLVQQRSGVYKYESVRKEIPVSSRDLALPAKGLRYRLPTGEPGDFVLIVRGPEDAELNRVAFSVVGRANLTRSLEKNAELELKLNKQDYSPGEEIELEIKAPYTGAGLITIERDRVYAHKWFKTGTTSTVQRIRVPGGIEGNGYVNVSFLRAVDSPEIFMSPLSFAVAPFSVSRARRENPVALESADLAKPGEVYAIRYSTRKPGKIVVYAVDEGILQVAGYKTPDPLGHFLEKRALEVGTAQILDLILPEFKLVQSLSAPGGDQGARALGKNLNPFRRKRESPVACWSGVISADETPREFRCPIPDYFNGTVRVMAVAVSPDSIGVAEKKAVIRGPFVLTPNVPAFVAPGDEFVVSVGLANNAGGSGRDAMISLELKASAHLEPLDGAQRSLKIAEGREGEASFRLRARKSLGSAHLAFTAGLGPERSRYSVDLSVRPPVPYLATITSGHLKKSRVEVPITRKMYPAYRILAASASPLPLGLAHGLVHYLVKYPYGCTEQLVSQAFPAIILRRRPEFGYSEGKVEANLQAALNMLRARQNAEGAFGFWAANSHFAPFQTVYALHFLTEAKDLGYPVPADLLSRGLGFLSDLLSHDGDSLADLRVRAYAVYVLTRNGSITTGFLNGLRSQLDAKYPKVWRKDLTGIYLAATYKLLKQDSQADGLIAESRLGDPQAADYDAFYDGLVRDAQLLYILARHFPERLKTLEGGELAAIVEPVTSGRYNTLSSAYTILALDAYADAVGGPKTSSLGFYELSGPDKYQPLPRPAGLFPKVKLSPQAQGVRIASGDGHPLFYQVTQAGFDLDPPKTELKEGLEVQREYRDGSGKTITSLRLGEEAEVRLKIRAIKEGGCHNIAVVDLLPGGFEPVLNSAESAWTPDYADFREDRVVVYGTVGAAVQEYAYKIKATNQGRFAIPPAFGESMYDRGVQARALGGSMIVTGDQHGQD